MGVLATDTFNRSNADPIDGAWADGGGANGRHFIISGNQAVPSNLSGGDSLAYSTAVTWPNDQYSQCVITVTGTNLGTGPGPGVRMTTGPNNHYRATACKAASNNIEFAKVVAGSYTSVWRRTQAVSDGDTLYIEVQGTTVVVKVNGTPVGAPSTDSAVVSGNAAITHSSTSSAATVDNWEGGDFISTPVLKHNAIFSQAVQRAVIF